jgi:DNA-binding response OmpR family regulator
MEKKKILIADDDESYRRSLKMLVETHGYKVDIAKNTDEEIDAAKKEEYELIITDKNMEDNYGREGGLHAVKEIRKFNSKTPILLSSSALTDGDKKILSEYKKVDTCSKIDIYQKLKKALGK